MVISRLIVYGFDHAMVPVYRLVRRLDRRWWSIRHEAEEEVKSLPNRPQC